MKLLVIMLAIITGIVATGFNFKTIDDPKPWEVPDADKSKDNPIKPDASSIADGKTLWTTHCQSCHGKSGHGDGPNDAPGLSQ